jgi:hypothetical protein
VNNWSDETTDDPLLADDRNYYKVEKWTKDGGRVERMLYAGSNLDKAREIFTEAIKSTREAVRAVTTGRQCRHLPGIKYSPSESYAEIGRDSLRTGLRTLCASLLFSKLTRVACVLLRVRPAKPFRRSRRA